MRHILLSDGNFWTIASFVMTSDQLQIGFLLIIDTWELPCIKLLIIVDRITINALFRSHASRL